jgi:hypothetical protein
MARIKTPSAEPDKVTNLIEYLRISARWQSLYENTGDGLLSQLWYRGVTSIGHELIPGVYRDSFTARARTLYPTYSVEDGRLRLEREMLSQFRTAGAPFLSNLSPTQMYFAAQHFGMPTRLLDWSTNPLAALYFACQGNSPEDGAVYAMEARKIIPKDAIKSDEPRRVRRAKGTNNDEPQPLRQEVMSMRNPMVEHAINVSFWRPRTDEFNPYVLPVRPDILPGRIGQQSSCFTLHMHGSAEVDNETLISIEVDGASKQSLRNELRRLNITQFTIFHDLDHLAKELRSGWGL